MRLGGVPFALAVGVFFWTTEASYVYVPKVLVACAFYAPDFNGLPFSHLVVEIEGEVWHITERSLRCAAGGFQRVGDVGKCCKEDFG